MLDKNVLKKIEERYGITSDEEKKLDYLTKLIRLDNEDKRDDSHRNMCWFSLSGMLIYPCLVMITDAIGLDNASQMISDMSGIYFASMSVIVMSFFGANAYKSKYQNRFYEDYKSHKTDNKQSSKDEPYDPF